MCRAWTFAASRSRESPAAAQAESGPPETIATADDPGSTRPLARTTSASASSASSFVAAIGRDVTLPVVRLFGRRRELALVVGSRFVGGAGAGDEQLDRGREARQLDLADRIELEVAGGSDRVGDGRGDQDLAPERPVDDPVGEVDVA